MRLSSTNAHRLIQKFEDAVREHEMKGSLSEEDQRAVESEYQHSKKRLTKFVMDCIVAPSTGLTVKL